MDIAELEILFPRGSGFWELSQQIREMKEEIMTALSDAVAQLTADDTQLEQEVAALIAALQAVPAQVTAAVQAALTAAGVDDTTQTAALAQVDQGVKDSIAAAVAQLTPPAPAPAPTGDDTITPPAS
jgi:phage shock protein A